MTIDELAQLAADVDRSPTAVRHLIAALVLGTPSTSTYDFRRGVIDRLIRIEHPKETYAD